MKVSNKIKVKSQLNLKTLGIMINMHIDLISLLLTWVKDKRHRWIKTSTI